MADRTGLGWTGELQSYFGRVRASGGTLRNPTSDRALSSVGNLAAAVSNRAVLGANVRMEPGEAGADAQREWLREQLAAGPLPKRRRKADPAPTAAFASPFHFARLLGHDRTRQKEPISAEEVCLAYSLA